MCPSYMVTREEMHTTRGRAHMLWEMPQRNPIEGGWKDDHVHEALDLCLSVRVTSTIFPDLETRQGIIRRRDDQVD